MSLELQWHEADLRRVLDYLRKNVGVFEEVKRKFGIGENLGLASLPEWHFTNDYAFVGQVVFENGRYYPRFFLPAEDPGPVIPPIPQDRIVVQPVCNRYGTAYLVSVYCSEIVASGECLTLILGENFFQTPELLRGIFAHECAEYILHFNRRLIFPKIRRVMKEKLKDFSEYIYFAYPPSIRDDLKTQCPADLLASLAGYKEELLSYLRFRKDTLSKGGDSLPPDFFRPFSEFMEELQARIDFIEKTA